VQKISTTGALDQSEFTISYDFGTERTLAQRLEYATKYGEPVTWTIQTPTITLTRTGTWMYSDNLPQQGAIANMLEGQGTLFSSVDGAWGAAAGMVNGYCVHDPTRRDRRKCPAEFYGILDDYADIAGQLTPESTSCSKLYNGTVDPTGRAVGTLYPRMKVFMYLETLVDGPPLKATSDAELQGVAPQHCVSTARDEVAATKNWIQNHWYIVVLAIVIPLVLCCLYRCCAGSGKKHKHYSKIQETKTMSTKH